MQRFEHRVVRRSQINPAPYNPRVIAGAAKGALAQLLEQHGLVELLVWNQRTGHLVGGHQRLDILDATHEGADYDVDVAAIDVTPEQEREINVALNNQQAQGEFDPEKFSAMLQGEAAPAIAAMGFTTATLEMEFGPLPAVSIAADVEADPDERETPPAASADVLLMIAFPSNAVKERFLMSLERPGDLRMMPLEELRTWLR